MKYKLLFFLSIPIFVLYILFCLFIPFIRFGKKQNKGRIFYIIKDNIHADFLFNAELLKDVFYTDKKYIIVGWGDRKIFLETKEWKDLKLENFIKAFYGLNSSVLRVQFTNKIPKNKKIKIYKTKYIKNIKKFIKKSFNKKIKKKKEYNTIGEFYESNLKYNCITNCNNWINMGLRECYVSNKIWTPLSFWI